MPRVDLPLVHLHSDNKGRSSLKQLFKGGGGGERGGSFLLKQVLTEFSSIMTSSQAWCEIFYWVL